MTRRQFLLPRYLLLLTATFACSWTVAHAFFGDRSAPSNVGDVAAQALPSAEAYDSATVYVREKLLPSVRQVVENTNSTWIVVLRGKDLLVCEDLGRQLREMRVAGGGARTILVWTDHESVPAVRAFLKREHLRSFLLRSMDVEDLFESRTRPVTPAMLVLQPDDSVVGISHPKRFPNVRLRSFAQELQYIDESVLHSDLLDREPSVPVQPSSGGTHVTAGGRGGRVSTVLLPCGCRCGELLYRVQRSVSGHRLQVLHHPGRRLGVSPVTAEV